MRILFFAYFRDYTGTKEVELEGCKTVRELLKELSQRYGKKFEKEVFIGDELSHKVIILVNGRSVLNMDGIETRLSEEDTISIFPVVAGG